MNILKIRKSHSGLYTICLNNNPILVYISAFEAVKHLLNLQESNILEVSNEPFEKNLATVRYRRSYAYHTDYTLEGYGMISLCTDRLISYFGNEPETIYIKDQTYGKEETVSN